MLAKCASPSCSAPFRYLGEGTLFRLEAEPSSLRHSEHFWLCSRCSERLTLRLDGEQRAYVAALHDITHWAPSVAAPIPPDRPKRPLLTTISFPKHRVQARLDSSERC
jgi:hypothetical protein